MPRNAKAIANNPKIVNASIRYNLSINDLILLISLFLSKNKKKRNAIPNDIRNQLINAPSVLRVKKVATIPDAAGRKKL